MLNHIGTSDLWVWFLRRRPARPSAGGRLSRAAELRLAFAERQRSEPSRLCPGLGRSICAPGAMPDAAERRRPETI